VFGLRIEPSCSRKQFPRSSRGTPYRIDQIEAHGDNNNTEAFCLVAGMWSKARSLYDGQHNATSNVAIASLLRHEGKSSKSCKAKHGDEK
jgi:hypothetical protein